MCYDEELIAKFAETGDLEVLLDLLEQGTGARGRLQVGPCPCECNSGGFCGGCGHAGCGGRRR